MTISTAANDDQAATVFSIPKNSQLYSSEYASVFSGPAAAHLPASLSPRDEWQYQTGSSSVSFMTVRGDIAEKPYEGRVARGEGKDSPSGYPLASGPMLLARTLAIAAEAFMNHAGQAHV